MKVVGPSPAQPKSDRAFALLAVFWCVGIMSVAILGFTGLVSVQLDENIAHAKDFHAAQLAESGLALGLHPSVEPLDPILQQKFPARASFAVKVRSEGARFNLNHLLAENQTELLSRLWVQWGLTIQEAAALNDCLADWVDADDNRRLDGAEKPEYRALGFPDSPANKPFRSLDEVEQVIGFAKIVHLRPDWQNFFTLWSDGRLDLNEAPAELLAVVFNIGLPQAKNFVEQRAKLTPPDSLSPYTFKSVDQPRAMLGLSSSQFKLVSTLVTVEHPIMRIESQGIVDRHRHTITVITKRDGKTAGFYLWQER